MEKVEILHLSGYVKEEKYMFKFPVITCINEKDRILLKDLLIKSGYSLYYINGKNITDETSFFKEIIKSLPQDPPLSGRVNYAAFLDSVAGSILMNEEEKVAFIWDDVNNIIEYGLEDFVTISCFLYHIQERLVPNYYKLNVFLLGKGNSFNKYDLSNLIDKD